MKVEEAKQPDLCVCDLEAQRQVSRAFLQTVIDAISDSLMVVDLDYRIVMANRAARETFGLPDLSSSRLKCYEVSHHRRAPCTGEEHRCPLREVVATRGPVRLHHTHYDADGKEISIAIDAAPIFDDRGRVVQVVESCRDVSEITLARRILRIGNRHMTMKPLLEDVCRELCRFTGAAAVGIHVAEGSGSLFVCAPGKAEHGRPLGPGASSSGVDVADLLRMLDAKALAGLPAVAAGRSVYVDDKAAFLESFSRPWRDRLQQTCAQCGCRSLALVPILDDGTLAGVILVAYARRRAISASGLESLERLAVELATAIRRVRAEEALQTARDELEVTVQQRTAELRRANQTLTEEIAVRTRLEREILQVIAREQQRIGQELHDGVGQELTGLSYLAQSLYQKLRSRNAAEAGTAAELAQSVPRVLGQMRQVVRGLVPLEVGASDLNSALEILAENVTNQTGIRCQFRRIGQAKVLEDDVAIQIYRIAQEAVANAVKHAEAKNIVVTFEADGGQYRLEVRDDGRGIEAPLWASPGCGLRTMRYRACAVGGSLEVRPLAEGGTLVACTIRCHGNNPEARGTT